MSATATIHTRQKYLNDSGSPHCYTIDVTAARLDTGRWSATVSFRITHATSGLGILYLESRDVPGSSHEQAISNATRQLIDQLSDDDDKALVAAASAMAD